MTRPRQLDVQAVRLAILRFAHDHDIESGVLMEALADVCGMTAGALDREVGIQSIDERMAVFTERAKQTYRRLPVRLVTPA